MGLSSLKVRFLLVSALVLALFSISAGLILRQAFEASIQDRAQEQLKIQLYGLLSAADFTEAGIELPTTLSEPRFNQLQSGLFAAVYSASNRIWQSQSFLLDSDYRSGEQAPGQWRFSQFTDHDGNRFYTLSLVVLWEINQAEVPFRFVVWESEAPYLAQIRSFEQTLWLWLGVLVIAAISVVFVAVQLGFKPFSRLAAELRDVEKARLEKIQGRYPMEITPVVNNLNQLIDHERSLRERYKNSLGDLAHSLKTPLAVLKGAADQADGNNAGKASIVQQQIDRMDDIVTYQLKRAISAVPNLSAQGALAMDLYDKMHSVLVKVYHEKNIVFTQDIRPGLRLPWDEADALEVLGNLMDNACKYGNGEVKVSAWIEAGNICLAVEDNGPGVPEKDRQLIVQRGARRDELEAGQGIGLSVVADIVSGSKGALVIQASALGGARFLIQLPLF